MIASCTFISMTFIFVEEAMFFKISKNKTLQKLLLYGSLKLCMYTYTYVQYTCMCSINKCSTVPISDCLCVFNGT